MMKVYETNGKIDPGVNPFVGQQLIIDDPEPITAKVTSQLNNLIPEQAPSKPLNEEMVQADPDPKPIIPSQMAPPV